MRVHYHGEPVQVVRTLDAQICIMYNDGITEWVDAREVR